MLMTTSKTDSSYPLKMANSASLNTLISIPSSLTTLEWLQNSRDTYTLRNHYNQVPLLRNKRTIRQSIWVHMVLRFLRRKVRRFHYSVRLTLSILRDLLFLKTTCTTVLSSTISRKDQTFYVYSTRTRMERDLS